MKYQHSCSFSMRWIKSQLVKVDGEKLIQANPPDTVKQRVLGVNHVRKETYGLSKRSMSAIRTPHIKSND